MPNAAAGLHYLRNTSPSSSFGGLVEAAEDCFERVAVEQLAQDLAIVLQNPENTGFEAPWPDEGHVDLHGVDDAGVYLPFLYQAPELLVVDAEQALAAVVVATLPWALAVRPVPIG